MATEESVFVIGGWTGSSRLSTIAEYSDAIWMISGSLKQARAGHGAITIEGITLIIGGDIGGPT